MAEKHYIRGYGLEKPFTTDNSGFSRWSVARKNGRRVFIKEFLSPVFPSDNSGLSERLINSKRAVCEEFYSKKDKFYKKLAKCQTGNIIWVEEFFRYGNKYYIITEYVNGAVETIRTVCALPEDKKRIIAKLIAFNLSALHEIGIVHSDLKPNNVLVKPTIEGYHTAKLIDFDASFTVDEPPKASDDVHGDFVYLAPEVFIRMRDEVGDLSEKLDIFSFGVLLHELWCGYTPWFPKEYNYLFEAVVNKAPFWLSQDLPPDVAKLIIKMLSLNPTERPSARECFCELGGVIPKIENTDDAVVKKEEARGDKRLGDKKETVIKGSPWKRAGDL